MSTLYQTFIPLSEENRLDARERAAKLVLKAVGDKPRREAYTNASVHKYPMWFTRMIALLMAIVFVASAMPSLFRLFSAGRDYFMMGIPDANQAAVVGASTFLLSEFLIVLSTIAARVYFKGRAQAIFIIPVAMGLFMALVGNWTVVKPHDVFSLLETIIPVLTVLFVALIGERLILESLETRHANERAYQEAVAGWQIATHNPEQHPRYASALANALRDALKVANSEGAGSARRKELMGLLSVEHWKALVYRELQADNWYATPLDSVPDLPLLPEPPKKTRKPDLPEPAEAIVIVEQPRPFGATAHDAGEPESMPITLLATAPVSNGSANGNGHHG